jgi:hypothetical protein
MYCSLEQVVLVVGSGFAGDFALWLSFSGHQHGCDFLHECQMIES